MIEKHIRKLLDIVEEKSIETKQQLTESTENVQEGLSKAIKRGLQGWGGIEDDPKTLVKRNKAHDIETAKMLRKGLDDAPEHSPAGLQKRVLDRKLKGVAEGAMKDRLQADAENMDLEAFLDRHFHHPEEKEWLVQFWDQVNQVNDEDDFTMESKSLIKQGINKVKK
jgi:hypothetical protein